MQRILALLALMGLLITLGVVAGRQASTAPASAKALEASLLAPCCFGGTLDVHDSELSLDLRREIEARVASGETTASIEADFVARYGPRIRAIPHAQALLGLSVAVVFVMALSGALLLRFLLGHRSPPNRKTPAPRSDARDAYDDRLDRELEALDEPAWPPPASPFRGR